MDRSRLINKWYNELNIGTQNDGVKKKFFTMVEALTDIELARPFFLLEKEDGRSIQEISIRYNKARDVVRYQIKMGKNSPSKQSQ